MGRARRPQVQASEARNAIMNAALKLLCQEGFEAVSLERVSELAGLNKMSIYRTYGSRDALALAYVERICECETLRWQEMEALFPDEPARRLNQLFSDFAAPTASGAYLGCAAYLYARSLETEVQPVLDALSQHRAKFHKWLSRQAESAGVMDSDELVGTLLLLWDGAASNQRPANPLKLPVRDFGAMVARVVDLFKS